MDPTKMQSMLNNSDLESLMNIVNLNSNLMEATNSIRSKNNEKAVKAMKALKDKPAVWPELIITSFSSQNSTAVEYMYENYGIDFAGFLEISPNLISSEILQDPSGTNKPLFSEKDKELYTSVNIPFVILAAICGDINIFHYVKEKGANLNITSHICLSKKQKNSVVSNILGAAAYYGRSDLTDYILKKHSVDINFKCVEKKVKKKQVSNIIKEFSDLTPLLLAIVSDAPESNSIEVIKHLLDKNASLSAVDFNKNTILHLAVKYNKLEIIKFFQDIFSEYLFVANKEGQTPFAIAQENNNTEILSFLNSIGENSESQKNIEEDLNELIESVNQQKNRRKKKAKNKGNKDEVRLLNSAAFSDTFKMKQPSKMTPTEKIQKSNEVENEKEEIVETNVEYAKNDKKKSFNEEIQEDKKRDQNKYENNFPEEYDEESHYDRNSNKNSYKQRYNKNAENNEYGYDYNYKYGDRYEYGYGYDNYYKGGRYNRNNYDRNANSGRYNKNEREYRNQERDNGTGNKNYKTFEQEIVIEKPIKFEEKELNVNERIISTEKEGIDKTENLKKETIKNNKEIKNPIHQNTNILNNDEKIKKEKKIFGLDEKTLKKIEKKEKKSKPAERKISKEENITVEKELTKENQHNEKEEKQNVDLSIKVDISNSPIMPAHAHTDKIETEKVKENSEKHLDQKKENKNENIQLENKVVIAKVEEKKEEIPRSNLENEKVNENVNTIINESKEKNEEIKIKSKENRIENVYVNENLLYSKELIKKYYAEQCLKLEESLENERKEKELYYNTLINKNLLSAKESLKNNNFFDKKNNEKLEDLLHLANSELESKSKKINQLNSRLEFLELKDVKNYSKKQLEELKDFFSNKLGIVVDALNNKK